MKLDIDIDGESICDNFSVIDLDTGKELDRCKWADDETGEYCEYDGHRNYIIKQGNIKLVYKGE